MFEAASKLKAGDVQTFLPYKSFSRCARVLDDKRLGKQRVEAYQILRTLSGETRGWLPHPVVKMWRGYESALARYGVAMCDEWLKRGFADTLRDRIAAYDTGDDALPPWLGNRRLHRSHQSNLVRKEAAHYRKRFPRVPDDLAYVWPGGDESR